MTIDIRKYLEQLCPDPQYDYSIPNQGGTEEHYNNITWYDSRPKPSWQDILDAKHAEEFPQQPEEVNE